MKRLTAEAIERSKRGKLMLKQLRERYSATELAQLLGVHRVSIYHWQDCEFAPKHCHLRKMAQMLGLEAAPAQEVTTI